MKPATPEAVEGEAHEEPPNLHRFPVGAMAVACLVVLGVCLLQARGHLIADTKLDLYVDPGRFLSRSLHLWDASSAFGQVQNQAVGYLFPMGSFFLLAKALTVPMWIAQRVWLALLLGLASWGSARVAQELRIGTPTGWVIAGLMYGLNPFIVGQLGSTSAGVIPAALAPWTLLPLIAARRMGSPRRAAARSGVAVLLMGGINAASTLCVLPLAALYLITRRGSPARTRLMLWWVGAVVLACVWWAVALVYQGHAGLDFIHFTETTVTTQSTTSGFEILRGTPNWLAYLHLGSAWLPAGWALATEAGAVLLTAGVAAAGAAGLAHSRLPERRFLVASFAFGVVCVGAGYIGPAAGLAGAPVQSILGGTLAAFRNTAKFEPVLALPLALGAAHLLASVSDRFADSSSGRHVALASSAALLAIVLAAAVPFWQGSLAARGSFTRVPTYWYRLADYMRDHAAHSRTLLMPSSAFAEYRWGRPMDEPLEPLASTPWAVRNLLPLGGLGSTDLLDSIETEVVDGEVSPQLGKVLRRAGISYVIARNDLAWQREDAPAPAQVNAALRAGGLRPVKSFGPQVPSQAGFARLQLPRAQRSVPALEVYQVMPGSVSLVHAYPERGSVVLSGGPQSLVQLADAHQLQGRAVLLAGDVPRGEIPPGARWIVSDAARRVGQDFGLTSANLSYTLAPGAQAAGRSSLQIVPPVPGAPLAVARYPGRIDGVSASSYGSWLLQLPELAPTNAWDADPDTAWDTGTVGSSVGQWTQANLRHPVDVSRVQVRLLEDGAWRPEIVRLTVVTQRGAVSSTVRPNQTLQTIAAHPGPTTFVRIVLSGVTHQTRGGATAGLRDVLIPGVPAATTTVQPPEQAGLLASPTLAPTFDFDREVADPDDLVRSDPEAALDRSFALGRQTTFRMDGTVLPRPGLALDALLNRTRGLRISASSSWHQQPRYRPANASDGSRQTSWVAAPPGALPTNNPQTPGTNGPATANVPQSVSSVPAVADAHPRLVLQWPSPRQLSSVRVVPAGGFAAPPTRLRLTSAAGSRLVAVAPHGGLVHFRPLRTSRLTISFPGVAPVFTTSASGVLEREPVGVAEIDFPALRSLQELSLPPSTPVTVSCRRGPRASIDGRSYALRLKTNAGAVVAERQVAFSLCTPRGQVELGRGTHTLLTTAGGAFAVTRLILSSLPEGARTAEGSRSTRILRWGADDRTVHLGAGAASMLAVRENWNTGWQATLAGRRLRPVRLEGWEQGFLVPAGPAGVVHLRYGPDRGFRTGLLIGGLSALMLIILALLPARRAKLENASVAVPAAEAHGGLMSGAGAILALALVGWPGLLALGPLVLLGRRRPSVLPWLAAGALLAAAAVVAVHVVPFPSEHHGSFGFVAEALSAITVAGILAGAVGRRGRERDR